MNLIGTPYLPSSTGKEKQPRRKKKNLENTASSSSSSSSSTFPSATTISIPFPIKPSSIPSKTNTSSIPPSTFYHASLPSLSSPPPKLPKLPKLPKQTKGPKLQKLQKQTTPLPLPLPLPPLSGTHPSSLISGELSDNEDEDDKAPQEDHFIFRVPTDVPWLHELKEKLRKREPLDQYLQLTFEGNY
ncbi:hypothetical protein HMI56_005773 [Coelomomyces lativittatus]|nr:hypothetical protein HMI56_005773 [Coelomomyces lativittatus]